MYHCSAPGRTFAATLLLCLLTPTAAGAAPVVSDLRVEGANRTLESGRSYVNDTSRIQTDRRPACAGSGATVAVEGPSALGILDYGARANRALRPLGVTDRFDFGPFVCGIDTFVTDGANAFWLFKVDHRLAEVGADKFPLRRGSEVLWYFSSSAAGANTGAELGLIAPARARPGEAFDVTVVAYDDQGRSTPAAGSQVRGRSVQTTDAQGRARIVLNQTGDVRLRAHRGADIPSASQTVCLNRLLSLCPARRGDEVVGTNRRDVIKGTAGADVIRARGGGDSIDVRRRERDRVECGGGRDLVRASRDDRVSRDCERVLRR